MITDAASLPASLWQATMRPSEGFAALEGDFDTEVAIVGAGFTGLAAARQLLQRSVATVVVEGRDVGWGASGRTGGLAVPRYKMGFAALARAYGEATTRQLHRLVLEAIDLLEETVASYGIACDFARRGHITAAHSSAALAELGADVEWLAAIGDSTPRILSKEEIREQLGSSAYRGGYLDPRGGDIHPLDYCRGFAQALIKRGVPIFVRTHVRRIERRQNEIVLETSCGRIRAKKVIIATNAYTESSVEADGLHRRIVPVSSSVVATHPLSLNLRKTVLPAGRPVSDTKHLLNYFRLLPNGQFLFGGRGDITGRRDDPTTYLGIERAMVETFPQLEAVKIAQRWSGMVAVTLDHFPHLGWIDDRVLFALGYGGRGVALANLMGKHLAAATCGESVHLGPITENAFHPIPFQALRVPIMKIMAAYYHYKDQHAE